MTTARLEMNISNVDEIITGVVTSSGHGAAIGIPKKYMDRKVKIIVLKESGAGVRRFRETR